MWQTILNRSQPNKKHHVDTFFSTVATYFKIWSENSTSSAFENFFVQIKNTWQDSEITQSSLLRLDQNKGLEGIVAALTDIFLNVDGDYGKLESLLSRLLDSPKARDEQDKAITLVEAFLQNNIPIVPNHVILAYRKQLNEFTLYLIEKKLYLRGALNELDQTQLHLACQNGVEMLSIVKALLRNGISIKHQDILGNTALHYACEQGVFEIVEELTQFGNGASYAYLRNKEGKIPLQMLCGKSDIQIACCLGYQDNLYEAIRAARQTNRFELINWLISLSPTEISSSQTLNAPEDCQAKELAVRKVTRELGHIEFFNFIFKSIQLDIALVRPESIYKELKNVQSLYNKLGTLNSKYNAWKDIFNLAIRDQIDSVICFCLINGVPIEPPKELNLWKIFYYVYENPQEVSSFTSIEKNNIEGSYLSILFSAVLTYYPTLHDSVIIDPTSGFTLFHLASQAGDLFFLKKLYESNFTKNKPTYYLNLQTKDGNTPLHLALQSSSMSCVYFLIEKGVLTYIRNKDRLSSLDLAIQHGEDELLLNLWKREKWVHPWKKIENQSYLLQLACQKRDLNTALQTIESLSLEELASFRYKNTNKTYLHLVCEYSWDEVADVLLNTGISFWNLDESGRYPLHWACEKGLQKIALRLIDQTDCLNDLDQEDKMKATPLALASQAKCELVMEKLIDKGVDTTAIMSHSLPKKIFHKLIEKRSINVKTLFKAVKNGFEAAAIAIKNIEDISPCNLEKLFRLACKKEMHTLVSKIKNKWTLVEKLDDLILKSEFVHFSIINNKMKNHQIPSHELFTTPLHQALLKGNSECALEYVQENLYVDALDSRKRYPIHIASEKGYLNVVTQLLMNPEVQKNQLGSQDRNGNTPLHLACSYHHFALAHFIVKIIIAGKQLDLFTILNKADKQPGIQILYKYPSNSDKIFIDNHCFLVNFDLLQAKSEYFKKLLKDWLKKEIELTLDINIHTMKLVFKFLLANKLPEDLKQQEACIKALVFFDITDDAFYNLFTQLKSTNDPQLMQILYSLYCSYWYNNYMRK